MRSGKPKTLYKFCELDFEFEILKKLFFQFMSITYMLQIAWVLMFAFLIVVTFVFTMFWYLCSAPRVENLEDCINLRQFGKYDLDIYYKSY